MGLLADSPMVFVVVVLFVCFFAFFFIVLD